MIFDDALVREIIAIGCTITRSCEGATVVGIVQTPGSNHYTGACARCVGVFDHLGSVVPLYRVLRETWDSGAIVAKPSENPWY